MASTGMQLLGLLLAVLGGVAGMLVCAAPLWRISAFVGGELVIAQVLWEGLWMNCLSQTTGHIQCKTYDSTLALPAATQVARTMTVLSLLLCVLALTLAVAGAKCTHCLGDDNHGAKARLAKVAGGLFGASGLLYLVPVCWTVYATVRDFYSPEVAAPLKRELGPALYFGCGASLLLLVGGGLLYTGSSPPGPGGLPAFGRPAGKDSPVAAEGKAQEKAYV